MWKGSKKIAVLALCLISIQACKTKELATDGPRVTERIETEVLLNKLANDTIDYRYLFTKIDADIKSPERNASIDLSIKLTKDSALLANVSAFNIMIASALIRKDSLFVGNKREKCFMNASINELSEIVNADVGFDELQNIVAGKIPYFNKQEEWQQLKRDQFYVISNHSDREIKKMLEKSLPSDWSRNDRIFRYFFDPITHNITASRIDIPSDTLTIFTEYKTFQEVDSLTLPKESTISINKGESVTEIKLKYKRTRINEPRELYYFIPENYVECP